MASDISELQAVDFAMGAVIMNAFGSLAEKGPDNYVRFLQAPVKDKIFRAEHEDAGALVKKIANAEKTESGHPSLPVVAYYRKPGLSNGEDYASVLGKSMFNDELAAAMNISILPVTLEYSMTFAAWDKPTLDKMQLAWYAFAAQNTRKNTRFMHPVLIGNETVEVPASIVDPKTIVFSDSSPDKQSSGRIVSVSYEFMVTTQVLVGESVVVPDEITVVGLCTGYSCCCGEL
jgi:hypothetical protein